jgi:hypothetical protein
VVAVAAVEDEVEEEAVDAKKLTRNIHLFFCIHFNNNLYYIKVYVFITIIIIIINHLELCIVDSVTFSRLPC